MSGQKVDTYAIWLQYKFVFSPCLSLFCWSVCFFCVRDNESGIRKPVWCRGNYMAHGNGSKCFEFRNVLHHLNLVEPQVLPRCDEEIWSRLVLHFKVTWQYPTYTDTQWAAEVRVGSYRSTAAQKHSTGTAICEFSSAVGLGARLAATFPTCELPMLHYDLELRWLRDLIKVLKLMNRFNRSEKVWEFRAKRCDFKLFCLRKWNSASLCKLSMFTQHTAWLWIWRVRLTSWTEMHWILSKNDRSWTGA